MNESQRSSAAALHTPPAPAPMSPSQVLKAAFSFDFNAVGNVDPVSQRRIGVTATVLGALIAVAGWLIGNAASEAAGVRVRFFYFIAGAGGVMLGIGAYRVGVSFFPSLAGTGRLASVARMLFVLMVMSVIGFGVLLALFSER